MDRQASSRVVEIAIEPRSKADQDKLGVALANIIAKDGSLAVQYDRASGQTVMQGLSERHLAENVDVLRQTYKIPVKVGALQIAYRETLGTEATVDYTHKKQTGGTGQFARVKLVFAPGEPGSGFVFEATVVGGSVPQAFIPGVEKGLSSVKEHGLIAGFPLIDFSATLVDGAFHDVDSSVLAFEIAARAAFKMLRASGAPKLLEPMMAVEVLTQINFVREITRDLNSRRCVRIESLGARDDAAVIFAVAPMAEMLGYAAALSACTSGGADFSMTFSHFAPAPFVEEPDPDLFPPAAAMRA